MLDEFAKTKFFQAFSESVKKEKALLYERLWDAPKALMVYFLLKATGKDVILVSSGERESRLYEDLLFFLPEAVWEFPAWETMPGEEISPSPDIMGKRLEMLHTFLHKKVPSVVLMPLQSLLQKVVTKEKLKRLFVQIKEGEEMGFELLSTEFLDLGYKRAKVVSDKGQFAIRGGIIDIFPISSPDPFRIEFFGDTIEQVRTFDPMSQKSQARVKEFSLAPADEYSLLVKEKTPSNIFEYLPQATLIFDDLVKLEDRYVALKKTMTNHSHYFLDLLAILKGDEKKIYWSENSIQEISPNATKTSFEMFGAEIPMVKQPHPFFEVGDLYKEENGIRFYFLVDNDKEEEKLKEIVSPLPKQTHIVRGYLSSGFVAEGIGVVPFTEFSHRYKVRRNKWRSTHHSPVSEFQELGVGELVVHFHNGIGKYLGIERQKNHLGVDSEFLAIEYAGGSKLYVPISQSHLISRYIGTKEELPMLHKLGTNHWQNTKLKVQQAIIGYAKELLHMQAAREHAGGFAFSEDGLEMQQFEEAFPYVETEDQLRAISDIKKDMISGKAMDRLVCGDVGYGKTEVAMRAAFKAVADGNKQVAVLVPTTVLAIQHHETFKERFSYFPISIGVVSRFQTAKENKKTLEDVKEGKIDILIGTHRLISKDVGFKDLGLIIIDEEQRFGVKAKESLKKFKVGVDSITMTATPIPRTLYLSLIGAKQMSVINSPPQDRLPIKTIISEREEDAIRNALMRELARDGQAFFIHNRVETIHKTAEEIRNLVPQAQIGIVHGQMDGELIDDVFHEFKQGKLNVLVATTIIENGIDIPNANTILIDRADTFGISDLYQLRGRVGRWNKAAYAYFLVPKNRTLHEVSQKRLSALVQTSGFGGGMKLAMLDLEIRGAGDILGIQQSGHAASIGFHLYCKLLKKAVDALQKKQTTSFLETKMEFTFDAKIPESYVAEDSLRLEIYHRLGEANSNNEAADILSELKDRFGQPPEQLIWLYHMTRLRIFATTNQFLNLKFLRQTLYVERQLPSAILKKSLLIPPAKSPEELEKIVIKRLTEEFLL